MRNIKEVTAEELERIVLGAGFQKFHARQVLAWVYKKNASAFDQMSDIPQELRLRLQEAFVVSELGVSSVVTSRDGTKKILFALKDGQFIEGVVIPAKGRVTGCVSSQAGCKFACAFCASGSAGFKRDLTSAEILDEVMLLKRNAADGRLTHIVFMGTGEPFDNYDNVMRAARVINDPRAIGIGARRITISTCGIIPGIERLMAEKLQLELSVSLHAPDDITRTRLMPVNRRYPLKDLIAVCRKYARTTKRQVTFEYIMMRGVNSDLQSARKLVKLLAGFDAKVNIIPCNPVPGLGSEPPNKIEASMFKNMLSKNGIPATFRAARGEDISAACGQLRLQVERAEGVSK